MLKETKRITMEGKCVVEGKEIAGFRAIFDTENPDDMSFHPWQIDKAACKEHRKEVRADRDAFEDYAYEVQAIFLNV